MAVFCFGLFYTVTHTITKWIRLSKYHRIKLIFFQLENDSSRISNEADLNKNSADAEKPFNRENAHRKKAEENYNGLKRGKIIKLHVLVIDLCIWNVGHLLKKSVFVIRVKIG